MLTLAPSKTRKKFEKIPVNSDWAFNNARSTEQWTHGYHRYPAKFLPNLVKKLIKSHTNEDDLVADLFAWCGTTLVEAKIHGRRSVGVDINPVAQLITQVKTRPIEPDELMGAFQMIKKAIESFQEEYFTQTKVHDRIDYWFSPEHKKKITFLYKEILSLEDDKIRDFFLVALSNILKNCSRWLQSSTKPQIDPKKEPIDPFLAFELQSKKMLKKNKVFFDELSRLDYIKTSCEIRLEDARNTSIESNTVGAIITSPPYVTSYEYADIHQLTGFWYEYVSDLLSFRKNFIGTFYSMNQSIETPIPLGQEIVNQILEKDVRMAKEVANYFNDMYAVGQEMQRILKPGWHTCLVIGNTTFRGIKILSAEVFNDILVSLWFEMVKVIKRSIPYKLIPTIRDETTWKFSKLGNQNSKMVYPEEYILIAQKKWQ